MESRSFVLRERSLLDIDDGDLKKMAEDGSYQMSYEMTRKTGGNMVMRGGEFWIHEGRLLMGGVILPSGYNAKGLEVIGRFTLREVGELAEPEVSMVADFKVLALSNQDLEYYDLDRSHLVESSKYVMEICEYSQPQFRKKYLQRSKSRAVDCITVQIDMQVSVGREELERPQARRDTLVRGVSQLLEDRGCSDMVIECQGERIPCHRAVLVARSPTFAGGLKNDFMEKREGRWEVKEASPAAVRDMLAYIYTGDLPQGVHSRTTEVLQLSSLYQLPELLEAARLQLVSQLTTDNAVLLLIELDKHSLGLEDGAKDRVVKFIRDNAREVVKGPHWRQFVTSYADLVTDIMLALVS